MILLFALLTATPAAQAAFQSTSVARASSVQASVAVPRATPAPRWMSKVESKYSGSMVSPGNEGSSANFGILATTVFKVSERMALRAVYGFNQIVNPKNEFTLTNPEFRMFYRLLGGKKGWSLSAGPTAALPLSQASQNESLYFAVGGALRISFDGQTGDEVGLKFYYDFGFNRNNHQYETSNDGESNTMSSIDHLFAGEYSFEAPFTVSAWLGFSSAWTYTSLIKNNYTVGQEVSFAASDNVDLALGHERGGDFLSPSGQSYNFGLFDAEESRFYMSLTLKI